MQEKADLTLLSIQLRICLTIFDTGAGLTIYLKAFRRIDITNRPVNLSIKDKTAAGATGQG